MDKVYDQRRVEEKWYKFWEDSGFFKPDPKSSQSSYSLLIPPPNLTGELHPGQAMQHAILDALARFKRMQGFDTLLLPGVDHAGIQFEGALNNRLAKEGLSKEKLGREGWLKRAWQFKEEVYKSFHDTWTVMGLSADWSREVFTLQPSVQRAVFEEFKVFWDQGLLYKGAYIVLWCPRCGTAIEDVEMEYEDRLEKLYFVKYKVIGTKDEYITVATTRPETIYADTGIAVYPHHPNYEKYVGMMAEKPLVPNNKPIDTYVHIIQDIRVDKEFGSGALKITPGHDLLDYQIGKDHSLRILHAIDKTGRMSSLVPDLIRMSVKEARVKTAKKLHELGVIEKIEDYTHAVPICERCKTTVEPLISEEWFIKMKPLAQKALKKIKKINFVPRNYLKILVDWIKDLHDWSISRSLWWGHQIPVWYCKKCNPGHEVDKDKEMAISLDKPRQACKTCKSKSWVQDDQVLDTWFSSGLWPLSTLGWPDETKELEKYYPWSFELTAPEIKYLWIARMVMLGLWFRDEIPFHNMFFHGTLRDLQGRKISKSLGNYFSPIELINQWGTDAFRMALYSYGAPGRDGRTSREIMDQRCKNFRNFITKLRNINKFIIDLSPNKVTTKLDTTHKEDEWIKKELDKIIQSVTKNLEGFRLHLAADEIYNFIWHKLADQYIEKSKDRRIEAQPMLEYVFKTSLELLHPFMPFITEELWQRLPHTGDSIMLVKWPKLA